MVLRLDYCVYTNTIWNAPLSSFSSSLVRLEEDRSSEPICLWQHQRAQRKSNPCRRQPPKAARSHAQPIPKKAPKAPGWVSMASGVDGASTLVSFAQIGERVR